MNKFYATDNDGKKLGETSDPTVLNNNYIYPTKDVGITLTIGSSGAVPPITGIFELEEIETGKEFSVRGVYE